MGLFKNICLLPLIYVFILTSNVKSVENIFYLNFDSLLINSLAGKSIILQLQDLEKKKNLKFKKISDEINDKRKKIITQKNVISDDEFKLKINDLNVEIENYKKALSIEKNEIKKLQNKANNLLIDRINIILIEYSEEKKVDLIINKKSIVLGKSNLEITSEIMKIIDNKVKKINLQ